jgi:hypothetical protein
MSRFDSDPPCDFLTYLEWRLGEGEDATARLLGEWLATYQSERRTAWRQRKTGQTLATAYVEPDDERRWGAQREHEHEHDAPVRVHE